MNYFTKSTNYSYTSNAGNGNGQLDHPVALLTADETSLAGNDWSSAYSANSYLNSGSAFWLLSPSNRWSYGNAYEFVVVSFDKLSYGDVSYTFGVRPVISFAPGTRIYSGSGTAADPWVVQ